MRLFAVIDPDTLTIVRAGFKTRGVPCHDRVREHHLHHGRRAHARPRARDSSGDVKQALDGIPWDKAHTAVFAVEGVTRAGGRFLIGSGAPSPSWTPSFLR